MQTNPAVEQSSPRVCGISPVEKKKVYNNMFALLLHNRPTIIAEFTVRPALTVNG